MKLKYLFIASIIFWITLNAQSEEKIAEFLKINSAFILVNAHHNSSLIRSEIEISEDESGEAEWKAVLNIYYKGFLKHHRLKCFIYFDEYPVKFIWGSDSNAFAIKTTQESMLEELKLKWNNFEFED